MDELSVWAVSHGGMCISTQCLYICLVAFWIDQEGQWYIGIFTSPLAITKTVGARGHNNKQHQGLSYRLTQHPYTGTSVIVTDSLNENSNAARFCGHDSELKPCAMHAELCVVSSAAAAARARLPRDDAHIRPVN